MNTILLVLCNALSCFIISTILFQFMNGKYKKSSRNRYVYIVIETTTVIFTFCINMLNHSILNLVVWGVLTGIIVYVLYYEDIDKPLRRIIECEALVFCMSVCESLGVILLQYILQAADIKNVNETMLYCLEVTFSKVILIFLYYTFINRFVKKSDVPYSKTRYIMYGIILLYSLINMSVIVENFKNGEENYLCAVKMAVGKLLRDGLIRITENNIELLTEEERKELAAKGTTKDDVVKRKKTQKSFGQTYAGDISKTRNKPEGSSRKEFAGKTVPNRSGKVKFTRSSGGRRNNWHAMLAEQETDSTDDI